MCGGYSRLGHPFFIFKQLKTYTTGPCYKFPAECTFILVQKKPGKITVQVETVVVLYCQVFSSNLTTLAPSLVIAKCSVRGQAKKQ